MLTWLFHENLFSVVELASGLKRQGKSDIPSKEVVPGPPPR
jgi:hypothetical protein